MAPIPESRDGAHAIMAERVRQLFDEGYSLEHDAEHGSLQLISAALAYAVQALWESNTAGLVIAPFSMDPGTYWPWDVRDFKASGDPLRSLAKAGALLAAAYDVAGQDGA